MSKLLIISEASDLDCQKLIARTGSNSVRRILAASKNTNSELFNQFLFDKDPTIASWSSAHATDTNSLLQILKKFPARAPWIIRNPNLLYENYEALLSSANPAVRLAIYINPATPIEIRKNRMTNSEMVSVCDIGGYLGASVVRSHALLANNEWLFEDISNLPLVIKRAIANSSNLTAANVETITKLGWHGWTGFRKHPLNNGRNLSTLNLDELLSLQCSVGDEEAIKRSNFTLANARNILSRELNHAEPYIIAKILSIFGAIAACGGANIAGTRIKSSAWLNPLALQWDNFRNSDDKIVASVISTLSNNITAWENFLELTKDSDLSLEQIADAATRI